MTADGGLAGRRLELWTPLAARISELDEILRRATTEQWQLRCEGEGWSVGLVGCHVGLGLRRQVKWIERVLRGRQAHDFRWERAHAINALVQRQVLVPDRSIVFRSLEAGRERWRRLLERMTDGDLSRIAFRMDPHERSVEWVTGVLVVRHIDEHMRSMRAALGGT